MIVLLATGCAAAADAAGEVWLISTRWAPRCDCATADTDKIHYWRLQSGDRWMPADEDAYHRRDNRSVPTTVFVHGNRTGRTAAIRSAWYVYRRMYRETVGQPFRFVIWSWPSDRVRGSNRKDVRLKACYSDVQGYYLAKHLEGVDPEVPLSLVGYSFGARVITGALHLLAGGRVAGRSLPGRPAAGRTPIRTVLVAAALDFDWLLPGRRNGLALSQVERVLVTQNACDPVLKWYPQMYRRGGPPALGYAGAACGSDSKIEPVDLCSSVGRAHGWACYATAPELRRRLAYYTFLESPPPKTPRDGPPPPDRPARFRP